MSNNRDTEILQSTMGNFGSIEITGTAEVTGIFTAFQFMEDSVVSAQTDSNGTSNADLTAFTTILAGSIIYGRWSAITLTSGSAIGYYGK